MYSIPSLRALLSKTGPGPVENYYPFYTNGIVYSQQIRNNDIYIAGNFTSVGKYSDLKTKSFCILNNSTAAANYTSIPKTLFNDTVRCSLVSGNYIYVGGDFTVFNNQPCQRIVKISLIDGSVDTSFDSTSGFDGSVYALALDGSGNIYAGGSFTSYKGTTRQRIAKISGSTAALDTTFDSASGFNGIVNSLALDGSGNLYAGGGFTTYKGNSGSFIKINATTAAYLNSIKANSSSVIRTIKIKDSSIYFGGLFTSLSLPDQYPTGMSALTDSSGLPLNIGTSFGGRVYTSVISGNFIYVGGSFVSYKGQNCQNLAKISLIDGSLDTTFNTSTGFNGEVKSIALDGSGNLYAGGLFSTYKGTTRQCIAKLNETTAALDTTFDSTSGFVGQVNSIVLDSVGNLYVGGNFTTYKGTTRQRIAKLNGSTAALDTTFDSTSGFLNNVYSIKLDGSGNLYVGGNFSSYKGTTRQYIAKLNATTAALDTTFDSTTGFSTTVNSILLDGSGNLYAGGLFTSYKGTTRQCIAKLNATTAALDTTFDSASGFNATVFSLNLDGSGNLYVGGGFTTYKGTTKQYLAKLNATNAALDNSFATSFGGSGSISVDDINIYSNGIFFGGFFNYALFPCERLNKVNSDLLKDSNFNTTTAFNDQLYDIALDNSGNLYAGGIFTSYKGTTRQYVAKLNAATAALDTTFDSASGFSSTVQSIALDSSGNLYAGGLFTSYKGTTRQRIAKLNGSTAALDTTFDSLLGFTGSVNSIVLDNFGNIYAGSESGTVYKNINNTSSRQKIAKISLLDGSIDSTFNTTFGFNGDVYSIVLDSSGNIYAAGAFTTFFVTTRQYIAKLNATTAALDTTFNTASGAGSPVNTILLDGSGGLYAGGLFTSYKGTTRSYIVKINASTAALDTTFDTSTGFNGEIKSIALDNSGNLYAGGIFTSYKGATRQRIAKLNATTAALDTTFDSLSGFSGDVNSVEIDSSGKLYVGGNFISYKGYSCLRFCIINKDNANLIKPFYVDNNVFTSKINNNNIYLGGNFTNFSSIIQDRGAYSDASMTLYSSILSNFNNTVNCSLVSGDHIYVGGLFTEYNSQACQRIVKISLIDGSLDTTFNTSTGFNGEVKSIALDGSGNLYVGGGFTSYKGTTRQRIAKISGSTADLDTTFDAVSGFNGNVNSLALDGSGNLYAGGGFTAYKGTTRQYIAKLNENTAALDTTFDSVSGFSSEVNSIVLDSSGNLYAGGLFSSYKGTTRQYIAKLNATTAALDTTFNAASGAGSPVNTILLDGSGGLYAGGQFTTYKSNSRAYIVKINASTAALDTTFDTTFGFNGEVKSIALDGSGNLYVGGAFTLYKNISTSRIVKINATTSALITQSNFFNSGIVNAISIVSANKIFIGSGGYSHSTANTAAVRIVKFSSIDYSSDFNFVNSIGISSTVRSIVFRSSGNLYIGGDFTVANGNAGASYSAILNKDNASLLGY